MTQSRERSDLELAMTTLRALWPKAQVVVADGRRTPGAIRFALLPSRHRVRAIVPISPRRAAAAGLAPNSAPVSARQAATRTAGRWGLRVGLGPWAPDQLEVRPDGDGSLVDQLADVLGEPVAVTVHLGTARANRKPVLRVLDRTGRRTLAFAKLGLTDVTRALVAREADALARLAAVPFRTFRAPRVLARLSLDPGEALVMSALPDRGRPGLAGAGRRAVIEELTGAFASRTEPVAGYVEGLHHQLADVTGSVQAEALRDLHSRLAARHSGDGLRLAVWHGDFTPWNLATTAGGTWLWDWERFADDIPMGLDELHYCVNVATQRSGYSTAAMLAGLRAAAWRPEPGADDLLRSLYVATIATRYVTAAAGPGGQAVASEAAAAVAALGALVGGTA